MDLEEPSINPDELNPDILPEWIAADAEDFMTAEELIDILSRVAPGTPVRFWIADGMEVSISDIYDDAPDPPQDESESFPDLRAEASSVNIDFYWKD